MKVKVIREFTDKHTRKLHRFGEVFECDEARLKEIQSVSDRLVAVVKEDKKPAQAQKEKKGE